MAHAMKAIGAGEYDDLPPLGDSTRERVIQLDPITPIIDWQPAETLPRQTVGKYLVWLAGKHVESSGDDIAIYWVAKCANGLMAMISGHMAYDYLDDEIYIIAWAPAPEGPTVCSILKNFEKDPWGAD